MSVDGSVHLAHANPLPIITTPVEKEEEEKESKSDINLEESFFIVPTSTEQEEEHNQRIEEMKFQPVLDAIIANNLQLSEVIAYLSSKLASV